MIDVQSLTMRFGSVTALNGISFQVPDGQILGLLGPNGAGKTTAMRILTTFLYPSGGRASVHGTDILKDPIGVRRITGYLPELVPLYADMQVDEYLSFVSRARGISGKLRKCRIDWVREACGLAPVWKHALSELSKGFQQRVGLAQALVHDPKVLILDEPTSGLDPLQIIGIRNLIKGLAREKTVIFSTHILQEAEVMADRIVIISEGRVVSQGTKAELAAQVKSLGKGRAEPTLEDIFIALLQPDERRDLP